MLFTSPCTFKTKKGEGHGQSEHVWGVDLCCRFTMTSLALHSRQCVSAWSPLFSRTPPHPTHYDVFNIKYEMYTINIAGTKSLPGVHYSPTHHPQQPTNLQHICCVHTVYKDIKFEKYEIYVVANVKIQLMYTLAR